jgi:endoglucanase
VTNPTQSTTVTNSATSSPTINPTGNRLQFGGVNIAGFDFGSYDTCGIHRNPPYVNPSNYVAQINHFVKDDKLNAFRLPVSWQYLINQFDGGDLGTNTLNQNNFAIYDSLVSGCLNAGASLCLLDLHNYARFNGKIIGQDGPSAAQFASIWSQLATKYASQSRVAFGLMNEPHDETCNSPNGGVINITGWAATLQTAVNAIRQAGATTQMILLPGKGWTHANTYLPSNSDGSGPALMSITDPAGGTSKLVFEVHEYLDSNNSGCNCDCVTNNVNTDYGRGGFSNLANYLRSSGRFALLTESGGLNNANCAKYLCQELGYLANNTDVFLGYTAWAAGGFDANYELTLTPTQTGNTWTDTSLVQSCVAKCFQGQC